MQKNLFLNIFSIYEKLERLNIIAVNYIYNYFVQLKENSIKKLKLRSNVKRI